MEIDGKTPGFVRFTAVLGGLLGVVILGGALWLLVYGYRDGRFFSYAFLALVPLILGAVTAWGATSMWQGDDGGAVMVRGALTVPAMLFLGGIGTTLFNGDIEYKEEFLLVFSAGAALFGGVAVLAFKAGERLR